MTSCSTHTPQPARGKACSGKCLGTCSSRSRVWVAAACAGRIALFQKDLHGHISPLQYDEELIFSSLASFQLSLSQAALKEQFDQLIIVGSAGDIAWIHMSLPEEISRRVVAEIQYPLMTDWFSQKSNMSSLTHALEHVFHS